MMNDVVGRDKLIERIWKRLEHGSIQLTAERRIGKTTVMQVMRASPPQGKAPIFLDLEKAHSPMRFLEVLIDGFKEHLDLKDKAAIGFQAFLDKAGGTDIGGKIKLPENLAAEWPSRLEEVFRAACSNQSSTTIVLLLDELPYMLQAISVAQRKSGELEGVPDALQILDILRAVRAKHPDTLRMIFAGSIGLHHVVDELRNDELPSNPTNDLSVIPVGPLKRKDAIKLAQLLLHREMVDVDPDCSSTLPEVLITQTDCVPFYLDRTIARLAEEESPVTDETVRQIIKGNLSDDNDPWELEHFRRRLKVYYPDAVRDTNGDDLAMSVLAKIILDDLALQATPQSINSIFETVKSKQSIDDRELVINLLRQLSQDHYLDCDTEKKYYFRFPLLQRWWVIANGL